ncbi:MAG: response regulator [Candidatus Dormibacteria bacterium]
MIRLLIADDHEMVRQGLQLMFEADPAVEVVATAASGEEAVGLAVALQPDVVLMDLHMPGIGGMGALRLLQQRGSAARVLVLTGIAGDQEALAAISAGAAGYVLKQVPVAQLGVAIRAVAAGQAYLDPAVTGTVISFARQGFKEAGGPWHLSRRELEVLGLISEGLSNREIAARLFLSEQTVRSHVKSTLRKMGKKHRLEAVLAALQAGLIDGTQSGPESPDFPRSGDGNPPPRGRLRPGRPSHTGVQPLT